MKNSTSFFLTKRNKSVKNILRYLLADVAQLVRALVCGTRCREFESHLPPHFNLRLKKALFLRKSDNTDSVAQVAKVLALGAHKEQEVGA